MHSHSMCGGGQGGRSEAQPQNQWASLVWLCGPLSDLIVQPLVGHMSDRCASSFGHCRPFIIAGAFSISISVLLIGYSADIHGVIPPACRPRRSQSMELFPQLADLDGPKSMELFPQLAESAEKEEPIKTPSLVNKINSSIGQDPDSKILIGMLDIYGFESFKTKRCLTDMPDSKKKLSSSIPGEEKG